jgi:hypothetical protein
VAEILAYDDTKAGKAGSEVKPHQWMAGMVEARTRSESRPGSGMREGYLQFVSPDQRYCLTVMSGVAAAQPASEDPVDILSLSGPDKTCVNVIAPHQTLPFRNHDLCDPFLKVTLYRATSAVLTWIIARAFDLALPTGDAAVTLLTTRGTRTKGQVRHLRICGSSCLARLAVWL